MNIFKKCRVRTALLNVMTVNRNCLCQLRGCRFGPPQTDAHSAVRWRQDRQPEFRFSVQQSCRSAMLTSDVARSRSFSNVLWIALISLVVFLEKVTSLGRQIAALAGIVLVAAGAWLLSMGIS
jgi:predicted metal-binding membrane protein